MAAPARTRTTSASGAMGLCATTGSSPPSMSQAPARTPWSSASTTTATRGRLRRCPRRNHGFLRRGTPSPRSMSLALWAPSRSGPTSGADRRRYSNDPNVPVTQLPHGFLLDIATGVFTTIEFPAPSKPVHSASTTPARSWASTSMRRVDPWVPARPKERERLHHDRCAWRHVNLCHRHRRQRPHRRYFIWGQRPRLSTRPARRFTPIEAPAAPPPPGRPELPGTQLFGINNRGQMTGVVFDSKGIRSFVLDNGAFTTIDAPDAVGSTPRKTSAMTAALLAPSTSRPRLHS